MRLLPVYSRSRIQSQRLVVESIIGMHHLVVDREVVDRDVLAPLGKPTRIEDYVDLCDDPSPISRAYRGPVDVDVTEIKLPARGRIGC